MSLTDLHQRLVYDAYPDTAYEPDGFRPNSTRPAAAPGTGRDATPGSLPGTPQDVPRARPSGFGNVTTRRMLNTAPQKFPWLTPELAEQELAIIAYQADKIQCALDTVSE